MPTLRRHLSCFFLVAAVAAASEEHGVRLKDLVTIEGVRANQLVGYGLVVGLNGTGDRQQTLFWLRKAVEERSHWMVWSRLDPRFNNVRGEAPFQDLVRQVFPKS